MTTIEDSMRMQSIAILLTTNDCPRPVRKKLYDDLLNLAKIKLNSEELEEYEAAFKKPEPRMFPMGYMSQHSYSAPVLAVKNFSAMTPDELAHELTNELAFRYATKRSPQTFMEIIKKAKKKVEAQDNPPEPPMNPSMYRDV